MVRFALLAATLAAAGCATSRRAVSGTPAAPAATDLTGIWEGLSRSTPEEGPGAGDTRIERQAWSLTQTGDEIAGFYAIELTMFSGDGRPYLCSREPRLQMVARVEVRGRLRGNEADMEEVGEPRSRGPCPMSQRPRQSFHAIVSGNTMALANDSEPVILSRKPPAQAHEANSLLALAEAELAEPSPLVDRLPSIERLGALPADNDGRAASAEGFWLWEKNSVMPDGDQRSEREEWHLVQDGSKIAGHYDRWVRQVSTDGHPYRCSGNLDFRVGTRYHVTGEVREGAIAVYERRFDVLEGGPCDPGSRRLDAYHGRIRGDEIRLMFSTGIQVLRRSRPDVPSQRF